MLLTAALLGGCPAPQLPDAGEPDADVHVQDAGEDAGSIDGGGVDAGVPDAGAPDAGELADAGPGFDAGPMPFPDNGVWLTRNYVKYSSFYDPAVVNDLALRMSTQYQVRNWFVNSDRTGSDGRLIEPQVHMVDFLENVHTWEKAHGYHFRIFAWVSGATTGPTAMDLTRPEIRRAVVEECQKLLSPTVPQSYVAGTTRPFDGVQIDFEPSGMDQVRFDALLQLMEELRAGLDEVGRSDALLSFAAHKLGTTNQYQWSPAFYYEMAKRVDVLASMSYNSGSTTGAEYRAWTRNQLQSVLRAVSGQAWTDGAHPPPSRPVTVLFGMPSYPPNASHEPSAENIEYGAQGLRDGINALKLTNDPSLAYLGGGAVYLHTNGINDDNYARWSTEWWWFGHYWLQRW